MPGPLSNTCNKPLVESTVGGDFRALDTSAHVGTHSVVRGFRASLSPDRAAMAGVGLASLGRAVSR